VLLDLDEYNITEKEAENIKLWYMDEKTGRWRVMGEGLKPHETRRSRRSNRRFYYGKILSDFYMYVKNLDVVINQRCYLKVRVDDDDSGDYAAMMTLLTTKGSLKRYQRKTIRGEPICIETYCTENEAIIQAKRGEEYLLPKETGIDNDVKSKHKIEYYRAEGLADRFSNRIRMEKLTRPLSPNPSPFFDDLDSCRRSPNENSFIFELPKYDELVEEFQEELGENWYPNQDESTVCYVKIAVENIGNCDNNKASFAVESLVGNVRAGRIIITMSESSPEACAEYKCPQQENHDVTVNVLPLQGGRFTDTEPATEAFKREMSTTVLEVFSFKPSFDLRNPRIGIYQSESEVFLNEKNANRDICSQPRIRAGIRFRC
jgi:hypothetical protein